MPWSLSLVRWGRTTMVKDLISSWPTLVIGAIELTSLDVGNFLSLIFGCCVSLVTHCSGGPHNGGERLDKPLVLWTLWAAELLSSHAGRQSFELDIWMLCKHHALVTQCGVVGRTKGVKELHLLVTLCKHL